MPVTKSVCAEGHILRYNITEPWQVEDMVALFPADSEYRSSAAYKVHTLLDVSQMRSIPSGWFKARSAPGMTHANSGYFAVVGINPGARQLFDVFVKLTRFTRVVFFNTDTDALDYLQKVIENETIGTPAKP